MISLHCLLREIPRDPSDAITLHVALGILADVLIGTIEVIGALVLIDIVTDGAILSGDATAYLLECLGIIVPVVVPSSCLVLIGLIHFELMVPTAPQSTTGLVQNQNALE